MLVFNKLSRESILQVVGLRLNDVAERLKSKRITLDVDQKGREWLADQGYSEVYGARAIARVVRQEVLFPLAQKLLKGTIRYIVFSVSAFVFDELGLTDDTSRDGDNVIIRVSEDGKLQIQDNHEPESMKDSQTSVTDA